jgi:hypothetical protein
MRLASRFGGDGLVPFFAAMPGLETFSVAVSVPGVAWGSRRLGSIPNRIPVQIQEEILPQLSPYLLVSRMPNCAPDWPGVCILTLRHNRTVESLACQRVGFVVFDEAGRGRRVRGDVAPRAGHVMCALQTVAEVRNAVEAKVIAVALW